VVIEQVYDPSKPVLGTLLVSEEVRGNFEVLDRAAQLKPYPGLTKSPLDSSRALTVWVDSGDYSVDSVSTRHFSGSFTNDPGVVPGVPWGDVLLPLPLADPRIDIVYLTASGTLSITQGVENPSPSAPPYPPNSFPIAEVTVVPGMGSITSDDIRDVRPMYVVINAGLGINPNVQSFVSTAGQTLFILTNFQYAPGSNEILVFAGGVYKAAGIDYVETAINRVTFITGRPLGENIIIYRVGAASAQYLADLNDVTVDLSNAIKDTNSLRSAPVNAGNPLASLADIGSTIPFGVQHDPVTGVHGPKVTILQTGADNALVVSAGVGASTPIVVRNSGASTGVSVIQSGSAGALSVMQIGNSNAIGVLQSGAGNALYINHNTSSGKGVYINFATTGVSNCPVSITRLATPAYEPLVNLHEATTPSGVNLSILNHVLTFADDVGNTPKFTFDVLNGRMAVVSGSSDPTHARFTITNTGTGNAITLTHGGAGHAINITNNGTGDCIRITNPGTGADIRVGGIVLDPLWGGPTVSADTLHTHNSSNLNGGVGIVLTSLNDVTNAEAQAFHDSDVGGPYRVAPATGLNPLSTMADILARIPLVKFGTYSGNGTTQDIDVGFEPDWVQVYNVDSATYSGVYVANGSTGRYFATTGAVNISTLPPAGPFNGGFRVSDGTGPINQGSVNYKYIATKGNVPLP
jgi:hypothetical protein